MLMPSLIIHMAFFYTYVEGERSKIARAIITIRHPSYPSIWAYVTHVILDTRLPLFSRATLKRSGRLGTRLGSG